MSLRLRVGAAIRDHALWSPGDRVAVAVSGGADSVALLDLLLATSAWHGGRLSVVTVDHGLRAGSDEDAAWVEALATRLGLACHRERVRPAGRSEAALRDARHAVFAALPVERVATGHHRGDQVETVLLRLLRGTATTGLAALRWTSGRIVRPLLDTEATALRAHLVAAGLTWREDPTNALPCADRNRVRHEVLPVLRAIRPGVERAIARTATRLAEEADWLAASAAAADPGLVWPAGWLGAAPPALARALVRRRDPLLTSAGVDRVLSALRRGRPAQVGRWDARPGPDGIVWQERVGGTG